MPLLPCQLVSRHLPLVLCDVALLSFLQCLEPVIASPTSRPSHALFVLRGKHFYILFTVLALPSGLGSQVTSTRKVSPTTKSGSGPLLCVGTFTLYNITDWVAIDNLSVTFTVPVIQCEWKPCSLLCFYGQICCLAHRGNSIICTLDLYLIE